MVCLILGLWDVAAVGAEDAEAWRRQLGDAAAVGESRLAAGRRLLEAGPEYLAEAYGAGDNAWVVRHILYESRDPSRMRLGLELLAAVGGEEAIDFERYLLEYGAAAVPGLEQLLQRALKTKRAAPQVGTALRVLDALGKLKARSAAAAVAALLDHPETWIRMGAAHALGDIGDKAYGPSLVQALGDSAYAVQNAALAGLAHMRWRPAYPDVVPLAGHQRARVRQHAAHALGEIGLEEARPVLRRLAEEDPDSGVRFMAARALARLASTGNQKTP